MTKLRLSAYMLVIARVMRSQPLAYNSVTVENICNYFRKVRHMFCFLECLTPGKELDQNIITIVVCKLRRGCVLQCFHSIFILYEFFIIYMKNLRPIK